MDNPERLQSPENFHTAIDRILDRRLTPGTIDTYGSTALEDLIAVTRRIVDTYATQPTIASGDAVKQAEDSAYAYFELDALTSTLDHVAAIADSIQQLDVLIENSAVIDRVIVPPDPISGVIRGEDSGELANKQIENRLKTTLFILEQDYDIDVRDPEQVRITTGITDERTMRNKSYYMVEVPVLSRVLLVCNQEGNATYVFDSEICEGLDVDSDLLISATKHGLNQLLEAYAGIGQRIVYSQQFISSIQHALSNPLYTRPVEQTAAHETRYLQKNERVDWSAWSLEDIVVRALELSPDTPLKQPTLDTLSKAGMLPSRTTITKRFGSIVAFQRACGFEISSLASYTNEQLVALALELSPNAPLASREIGELSKAGLFLSWPTIIDRFGSIVAFQRACGFEISSLTSYTNEQLIALALELSPNAPLVSREIGELSKAGLFISWPTIIDRFGSIAVFHQACGFEK